MDVLLQSCAGQLGKFLRHLWLLQCHEIRRIVCEPLPPLCPRNAKSALSVVDHRRLLRRIRHSQDFIHTNRRALRHRVTNEQFRGYKALFDFNFATAAVISLR